MKRVFAAILFFAAVICVSGCGGDRSEKRFKVMDVNIEGRTFFTGELSEKEAQQMCHYRVNYDDEGRIVFTTATTTVKGRNLRRDPRASLCVDDERPPFAFVRIDGEVTLDEDMEAMRRWATAIGGRYMGADRAAEFGRRNAVEGEMLVRLTPTHVVARGGVSD